MAYFQQFREKVNCSQKIIKKETAEDDGKVEILHIFRISNVPRDSLQNKNQQQML